MRVPFYDIKAQYDELAEEMDRVVHEVLSSGNYMLGPHHNALEQEVANLHGCRYGIGLNSGTDALRIMLDASDIGAGDEVITTAFTFVASVETIVACGATPVLVDIDPVTLMIDADRISAAITPKTRAIMPIHLFGQLSNAECVKQIADAAGLVVLEDAAQAIGCHHEGRFAGKFGLAAGFSFYVTKNLGAAGDAGMILTDDEEFAQTCKSMRMHGMDRQRYYYDYIGYTSRLDEIQAAVLRVKLKRLDAWNAGRQHLSRIYLSTLSGVGDVVLPVTTAGNNNTWHQFTIQTSKRDALKGFLKDRGVDSMIYYPAPIHFHAPYAKYGGGQGSLPITERVCERVLSLPIHQHLSGEQVQHVADSVREFFA